MKRGKLIKILKSSGCVFVQHEKSLFLEIMNKKASNGLAFEAALKNLNIKPEEVITFGDEENDISM